MDFYRKLCAWLESVLRCTAPMGDGEADRGNWRNNSLVRINFLCLRAIYAAPGYNKHSLWSKAYFCLWFTRFPSKIGTAKITKNIRQKSKPWSTQSLSQGKKLRLFASKVLYKYLDLSASSILACDWWHTLAHLPCDVQHLEVHIHHTNKCLMYSN